MLLVSQMLRPRERIHVSGIQGQKAKVKVKAGLQEVTKLASSAGRVGGGKSCRHLFPIQGGSGRLRQGMEWGGFGNEGWTCLMPLTTHPLHLLPLLSR